jgi:hypothetical protein
MTRNILIGLATLILASPCMAAEPASPQKEELRITPPHPPQLAPGRMAQEGYVQTKAEPLKQSLEQLLNAGWIVASGALQGIVLREPGIGHDKWVVCALTPPRPQAQSLCLALN